MKERARTAEEREVILAGRISIAERHAIDHVARANDRTPSREVRRAVRFYLAHLEAADAFLRDQSTGTAKR